MEYTKLKCTERVCEAIESAGDSCGELKEWKESGSTSSIPFPLLLNIHTTAAKYKQRTNPLSSPHMASFFNGMVFADGGGGGLYLHELLEGSELVLPSPDIQPQRVSGPLYQR